MGTSKHHMPNVVSFKDFTPVQYTGGESEMQDRYAFKRKHQPMDEAETTTESTVGRIRARMQKKGLRRQKRIAQQ